jgi:hypothetical protein
MLALAVAYLAGVAAHDRRSITFFFVLLGIAHFHIWLTDLVDKRFGGWLSSRR